MFDNTTFSWVGFSPFYSPTAPLLVILWNKFYTISPCMLLPVILKAVQCVAYLHQWMHILNVRNSDFVKLFNYILRKIYFVRIFSFKSVIKCGTETNDYIKYIHKLCIYVMFINEDTNSSVDFLSNNLIKIINNNARICTLKYI